MKKDSLIKNERNYAGYLLLILRKLEYTFNFEKIRIY